jgi:hypothetical protein
MISKPNSEREPNKNKVFGFFVVSSFLEGLFVILWIVRIPADPKNALLLGFSLKRLILLSLVVGGVILLLAASVAFYRRKEFKEFIFNCMNKSVIGRISGYFGLFFAIIALVPVQDWGPWGAIYERSLPLIMWLCLLFLQCSLVVLLASGRVISGIKTWVTQKVIKHRRAFLFIIGILLACYFLSIKIYPGNMDEDYWYETGIPILWWQVIAALVLGIIFIRFEEEIHRRLGKRIDITIFLLIFLSVGLLWAFSPLRHSYFNPKPLPPNNVFYPYSDAADFDLQAQSTMVGLGFDTGTPLDRPFYPLLLAIIHLFSGQNYADNMMLQAFLYGVFPAIVYLICAEMGARRWGFVTSVASGLWGRNFILANNVINTSTPKQMLSDFPLMIVLSLVLLFTIRWLKGGPKEGIYAFITGGLIALSAYVRYSALLLLPLWVILAVVKRRELRTGLKTTGLLIAGVIVLTMPWYARNISMGKNPYIPFSQKIFFIIKERYPSEERTLNGSDPLRGNEDSAEVNSYESGENQLSDNVQEWGEVSASGNDLAKPFINWFTAHMGHNIMSSLLILPSSMEIASLDTSLEIGGDIWFPYWGGQLPLLKFLIVLLQFFILSAGLVSLIQRDKTMTGSIILMFFGIHLANSLGRTSGGRYIVPVNWLVLLVYFAGILFLFCKLTEHQTESRAQVSHVGRRTWILTILSVLVVGALPVIYERISLSTFSPQTEIQSIEELINFPSSSILEQEVIEIAQFLEGRKTRFIQGYAFYPRQQLASVSIKNSNILGIGDELRLLTFRVLHSGDAYGVAFPYEERIDIQNQDKVILVGCKVSRDVLVRNLIVIRGETVNYYTSDHKFDECIPNN